VESVRVIVCFERFGPLIVTEVGPTDSTVPETVRIRTVMAVIL
jgi:hypothetical protein